MWALVYRLDGCFSCNDFTDEDSVYDDDVRHEGIMKTGFSMPYKHNHEYVQDDEGKGKYESLPIWKPAYLQAARYEQNK